MLTDVEKSCIWGACDEYKRAVSRSGRSVNDFYNTVIDNADEFKNDILNHPFFKDKNYESLSDVYNKEQSLFIYCLQKFLNKKLLFELVEFTPDIPGTPHTIDTDAEPIDTTRDEETENKKEFIKEVMEGVEKKKTLKDFLTDPRSYKQFRDQVDECMFWMNWEKIHRIMKKLKWKWVRWEDEEFNVHEGTVPSIYGIKRHVYDMIKRMEDYILEHGDEDHYLSGTGGFEYEMWVCEPATPDDFDNRVRLVVRFVPEQFDTRM